MNYNGRPELTAVLGPTNTGKTHLAIERMLAHSSGMIGFPLRLLAREVYDRVVRMRGAETVALVTGEERIWPDTARYLMCTAEAMPLRAQARDTTDGDGLRDVAFVALDEAQLAQDYERGHVFTSRLLHARGREETMILGSGTMVPAIRTLLPSAEITSRPRFSTLSYDGPRKLRRLPPRTAIIAFSAEEVYSIAEALRRISGGAAVVMGALSPATRNAQVAMFQAGEVDYLVATDAVGMGLNLQVEHVAFASLNKFDGVRHRRLTVAEMAQIAGRAGRHQRDGTFGSVGGEPAFTPEEISAIEEHRFDPVDWLYWRNPDPSMDSVAALIADLSAPPTDPMLRPAPLASDLSVMQSLSDDAQAMAPINGPDMVRRFRDVCALPDFRRVGPDAHRRLVARIWSDVSQGNGHVDSGWFNAQLRALDVADGAVEVLADRIAAVRSFCYTAQRADWVADPAAMAQEARDVEARLSDALHNALTARFVDRRTSVLLRALGQDAAALPVAVDDAGVVRVDGEGIGTLNGFDFVPEAGASAGDRRMLLAAAEKYLAVELATRATGLAGSNNSLFTLDSSAGAAPKIIWQGHVVATLVRGKHLLSPRVVPTRALAALDAHVSAAVQARLSSFVDESMGRFLRPIVTVASMARDAATPANVRAICAALVDGCGVVERAEVLASLRAMDADERKALRALRIRAGYLDLFMPSMLKPRPVAWLTALRAAWRGAPCQPRLADGLFMSRVEGDDPQPMLTYRRIGGAWLRVDLVEKMALTAHAARVAERPEGDAAPDAAPPQKEAFQLDPALATSFNLPIDDRMALMRALDFATVDAPNPITAADEAALWWVWKRQGRRTQNGGRRGPGKPQQYRAKSQPRRRQPDHGGARPRTGDYTDTQATGGVKRRQQVTQQASLLSRRRDGAVRGASPFSALAGMFDKAGSSSEHSDPPAGEGDEQA